VEQTLGGRGYKVDSCEKETRGGGRPVAEHCVVEGENTQSTMRQIEIEGDLLDYKRMIIGGMTELVKRNCFM